MAATESATLAAVSAAMDAALIRQQASAANIASAHVPGYTPVTVRFSARIDALLGGGWLGGAKAQLDAQVLPMEDANGAPMTVRLDDEAAHIAQNALHYQALVKGLNKYMSTLSAAVSEGKR